MTLPRLLRRLQVAAICIAAFAPSIARAQYVARQAARADLDTLQRILETSSAYLALNRYDYRAHLDSLKRHLPDSLPTYDFRFDVLALVGRLQDAHSVVDLPAGVLLPDRRELPFATGVHAGRVVALGTADSGLLVTRYPYLAAINSVSTERLLAISGARFRGHSPQRFLWRATTDLVRIPFILRRAGALRGDTLVVSLTNAAGRDTTILMRFAARQPQRPSLTRTTMLEDSIAFLRIETMWAKGDPGADLNLGMMRAAMESSDFQTSRGLIIDVRGNTGGSRDVLEYLAPFFIDAPLAYNAVYPVGDTAGMGERSLFHPADPRLDNTTRRVATEFTQRFRPAWRPSGVPFLDQVYVAVLQDRPTPHEYSQKPVVVLMDAGSFSATDIFLSAFAQLPQLTLLGTTSAGGSGRSRRFNLPQSRIRVTLSTMASFRPDGRLYDGYGIEPDVVVEPTLSDVAGLTDSQLRAAITHIQQRAKRAAR